MVLTCSSCTNGIGSDGQACSVCGGDGEINLTDEEFGKYQISPTVHGMVWSEILTQLDDLTDKVDDVMDKCNDIFEKVNE